jgi:hypothetical protein
LTDGDFDLWSNLYSFVVSGLKKAMFGVYEVMDQISQNDDKQTYIPSQFGAILKDLSVLQTEVDQLKDMDWKLLY